MKQLSTAQHSFEKRLSLVKPVLLEEVVSVTGHFSWKCTAGSEKQVFGIGEIRARNDMFGDNLDPSNA